MASSTAGAPRKALFMVTIKDIADIANARTPMQWDDSPYAGFSDVEPWIEVNENYHQINAASQLADPDSVFHYYQKLIRLRKEHPVIVYGHYELLDADNEAVFTYTREYQGKKLLCVCNFTGENQTVELPEEFRTGAAKRLIGNYPEQETPGALRPWEALALLIGE